MKKTVFIIALSFFTTVTIAQKTANPTSAKGKKEKTEQKQLSTSSSMTPDFTMPAASPKVTTKQQFSTSAIELEYSRPSAKGRKIFGEMVPFGKPWRTGANAATKITFGEEVIFGGQKVEAGTYALYTIPNNESWIVILNTNYNSSGLNDIKPEDDVVKIEVRATSVSQPIETFTIELNDITSTRASLNIMWQHTKVSIPIHADNKERILSYLKRELNGANPPYRDAAFYFEEIGYELESALQYANRVLDSNPKAFWIHSLKARIYSKMGDRAQALRSAEMAAELTKGTGYEQEYAKKAEEYRR